MNTLGRVPRQVLEFLLLRRYRGYYVVAALFAAEFAVTGISSIFRRGDPGLQTGEEAPSSIR